MNTRNGFFVFWIGLAGALGACDRTENSRAGVAGAQPAPTSGNRVEAPPRESPRPARVLPAIAIVTVEARCRMQPIFFATDSAALTDEARQGLTTYAQCLLNTTTRQDVILTGRADPRGSEPYNETLSEQRAEAVATFLQSQGVPPERIEIRALGEEGVIEGMPQLWPVQRRVTAAPMPGSPGLAAQPKP